MEGFADGDEGAGSEGRGQELRGTPPRGGMGKFVCYEGFTGFYFLQIRHNKGVIGKFVFLKGLEATKRPGWWPGHFIALCLF